MPLQVGACIVDKKGQIVGIGYNSMPKDKDSFTWKGAKDKKAKRDEKDFTDPKLKYAYGNYTNITISKNYKVNPTL